MRMRRGTRRGARGVEDSNGGGGACARGGSRAHQGSEDVLLSGFGVGELRHGGRARPRGGFARAAHLARVEAFRGVGGSGRAHCYVAGVGRGGGSGDRGPPRRWVGPGPRVCEGRARELARARAPGRACASSDGRARAAMRNRSPSRILSFRTCRGCWSVGFQHGRPDIRPLPSHRAPRARTPSVARRRSADTGTGDPGHARRGDGDASGGAVRHGGGDARRARARETRVGGDD